MLYNLIEKKKSKIIVTMRSHMSQMTLILLIKERLMKIWLSLLIQRKELSILKD